MREAFQTSPLLGGAGDVRLHARETSNRAGIPSLTAMHQADVVEKALLVGELRLAHLTAPL